MSREGTVTLVAAVVSCKEHAFALRKGGKTCRGWSGDSCSGGRSGYRCIRTIVVLGGSRERAVTAVFESCHAILLNHLLQLTLLFHVRVVEYLKCSSPFGEVWFCVGLSVERVAFEGVVHV